MSITFITLFNLLRLRTDVFSLPLVEPLIPPEAAAPLPCVVFCLLTSLIFPPHLSDLSDQLSPVT